MRFSCLVLRQGPSDPDIPSQVDLAQFITGFDCFPFGPSAPHTLAASLLRTAIGIEWSLICSFPQADTLVGAICRYQSQVGLGTWHIVREVVLSSVFCSLLLHLVLEEERFLVGHTTGDNQIAGRSSRSQPEVAFIRTLSLSEVCNSCEAM